MAPSWVNHPLNSGRHIPSPNLPNGRLRGAVVAIVTQPMWIIAGLAPIVVDPTTGVVAAAPPS
jgi:hypothetical protein